MLGEDGEVMAARLAGVHACSGSLQLGAERAALAGRRSLENFLSRALEPDQAAWEAAAAQGAALQNRRRFSSGSVARRAMLDSVENLLSRAFKPHLAA